MLGTYAGDFNRMTIPSLFNATCVSPGGLLLGPCQDTRLGGLAHRGGSGRLARALPGPSERNRVLEPFSYTFYIWS